MDSPIPERTPIRHFTDRVLILVAIGLVFAAAWLVADLLLLVFGAVLVALALRKLARILTDYVGLGDSSAVVAAILVLMAILAGAGVLFGAELAKQLRAMSGLLVEGGRQLATWLEITSVSDLMGPENAMSRLGALVSSLFAWGATVVGAAAGLLLVIVGGIYLALDPERYRVGLVRFVPGRMRAKAAAALDEAGEALGRWLITQLLAMLLVGLLAGAAFWLIGLPSALALGVIAGLAEFIPIAGPVLAAIPALVIAASLGWETTLWTLGAIVLIQQIENNLILPLLVGGTLDIAPAVALFAIVAMGMIFGPLGLLFGFPLTVLADVLIRRLYLDAAVEKA